MKNENPINPDARLEQYLQQLNDRQKAAVQAVNGPVLLLAVPGSGKTMVLVTRLGYLIYHCGIAPSQILTVTYTVAAAGEMRQRFAAMFGAAHCDRLAFWTINGLCCRIIEHYGRVYGRTVFQLAEEGELLMLLGEIYQEVNQDFASPGTLRDIKTSITYVKNQMLSAEEIKSLNTGIDHFPEILEQYKAALIQRQWMDYDDQMVFARRILEQYPDVLLYYQNRFPYLCVDEAQDTSKIQHAIIRLLAGKSGNLFMVGDEDQSIYGFRAAYPDALVHFESTYPGATVLLIEENYRSTPEILDAANGFIQKNLYRHRKTARPIRQSGEAVHIIYTQDRQTQTAYLLETVRTAAAPAAVLYRNNDSALPLIDCLEGEGIGYACKQMDDSFFSHRIVTDIIDIIHFAADQTDCDLFLRTYYKLNCGISRKAAAEACRQSRTSGKTILWELLRLPDLVRYTRERVSDLMDMFPLLQEDSAEMGLKRVWNRIGYGKYAEDSGLDTNKYEILALLSKRQPNLTALLQRLEQLRRSIAAPVNQASPKLLLSTIHSSKGLEYDTVYLLDVIDGILPGNAKLPKTEEEERLYYEERRLFYVGMTRAKNRLFLFACGGCDSVFLDEILRELPAAAPEDNDVFASIHGNLCGKHYFNTSNGEGTIIASGDDRCLISYQGGRTCLLPLSQMLAERKLTFRKEKKPVLAVKKAQRRKKTESEEKMDAAAVRRAVVGQPMIHARFGRGTISKFQEPYVTVWFPKLREPKVFELVKAIRKGQLRFEE